MPSLLGADYRRDLEIHRYPLIVNVLVPLAALVLQSWLPRAMRGWALFDLPLVITIYFSLGRRSPIQGTMLGAILGLFQDALTHHAIGLNGIAKTVAGFLAASVGLRIDVDNHLIRVMVNLVLSLLASAIYLFVSRFMLGLEFEFRWIGELIKAVDNAVIALFLYPLLDKLQVRE
jgi:rod shape-determining protein MreD